MDTFLQNIAGYLYRKYGDSLSDCALVFPNRRAGLFFTRYLSSLIDRPVWLPKIFTISDLLEEASSLRSGDPISLNFELYKVFQAVTKSRESFDEFYNWGEILIADFDEIDKYMADAGALFRNVAGIKNLEQRFDYLTPGQVETIKSFWSSFKPGALSRHQEEFLRIWEALSGIYSAYRQHLFERDLAYEGMIFRHAAEKVTDGSLELPGYEKYFVAGFNALNECEKVFFDYLLKEEKVEFFWDYDEFYTLDASHQAGIFMRDNLSRYPHTGFEQETRHIEKITREIDIIAVASNSGQSKILPELKEMFPPDVPLGTCVILPDEALLLPVLSSLPETVSEINVTMGYPLKDTPVYGFVMHLLSLHKNSRQPDSGRGVSDEGNKAGRLPSFYYKDVLALLQHPDYPRDESVGGLIRSIRENNLIYVDGSRFSGSEPGRLIFREAHAGIRYLDYISEVLIYISAHRYNNPSDGAKEDNNDVGGNDRGSVSFPGREFIFRMLTGLGRLKDILTASGVEVRFDTLARLIQKVLSSIRVPFYGEPLGGVQVMGVLETRALDFENVIWMSVNEGVFPSRRSGSSFIPWSLRRAYGLPGIEQHDAVYAYYFYRMLQRTRRMTLVYNTKTDGLFTGEPSRFIYQLKFSSLFKIRERSVVFNLLPPVDRPVNIEKTDAVMEMLRQYTGEDTDGKYLSAAAINSYIDCSLRFYFRYIARLPEPETVTEEVDMAVFGNLFHTAAHLMYKPYIGKDVTAGIIDELMADRNRVDMLVRLAFSEVLKTGGTFFDGVSDGAAPGGSDGGEAAAAGSETDGGLTGVNLIIAGVIATYIRQLLAIDRRIAPFMVTALEDKFTGTIKANVEDETIHVRIGGIIDRIDEAGGRIRVVDYKTGNDDADFRSVESLFGRNDARRRRAVFQTMLYAWLYLHRSGSLSPVTPMLYQARKFFGNESTVLTHKPGGSAPKPVWDFREHLPEFEKGLQSVLSELFDARIGFTQAGDHGVCRYCPYSRLCHRE
jgi:hypothetical protein